MANVFKKSFFLKLIVSVVVIEALGSLGALVSMGSLESWYASLDAPPGRPPNWVFGPVWTLLYAMMGVAFALVWQKVDAAEERRRCFWAFGLQLAFNLSWTPLFFGAQMTGAALLVILSLLALILWTIKVFRAAYPPAAYLLLPYAAWVAYASYLNLGYWWLNR